MKKIIICLFAILLTACGPSGQIVKPPMTDVAAPKGDYLIGVGDQLSVNVWRNPELSVMVPVRPDGRISTPLVGDIQASGKTPQALAEAVKVSLGRFVRNPEVTVIVNSPRSMDYVDRVKVIGAVRAPSTLPFREGMTVLDLVLEAGGVTEFAAANKAILYRVDQAGKKKPYPVYLDDILQKGKLDTNFALQPLDIITVPERIF